MIMQGSESRDLNENFIDKINEEEYEEVMEDEAVDD
jgi:hypothetical protein